MGRGERESSGKSERCDSFMPPQWLFLPGPGSQEGAVASGRGRMAGEGHPQPSGDGGALEGSERFHFLWEIHTKRGVGARWWN